jgi:NADH-quinone oxidoreductase subunit G
MAKLITLKIDDRTLSVPEGMLIVDAAKKVEVDIPVFCYHPKMEPVGMCRMCLVDIGRPVIDRATGKPVLEADGSPRIQFGAKLETACTTPVSEGMQVVTTNDRVKTARREMLEFLLTSHPLDCPVCDKGGECPLQNLTMQHGPGESRYIYDEKAHNAKHVPLGELIWLDRERCIQCGRCTRFQHEVVDDPVIGFHARGRGLEIITYSEPGFDSIFSGNTTDICPVGALTTGDFRFGARPWELKYAASICNQCPVGCNIVFNVRREAAASGKTVIKRVMPRQNESVNEIWMCDKGRFAYHYVESDQRLMAPLVRKDGELRPATWEEALSLAAEKMRAAGPTLVTLASGRLSNEDLYNLRQLNPSGEALLYSYMGGGDLVARVGVGLGTNFAEMGKGTTILVVASDLHQEAPVWWLRIKQAAKRGATLIVASPRYTRLEKYATHVIRYAYGEETQTVSAFMLENVAAASENIRKAAEALSQADNAVILYGSEGLGLAGSTSLAHACARLLEQTNHTGRPNNGLIAVWPEGNTQGAWDMGFRPAEDLAARLRGALVAYIAGADPAGDDPSLAQALELAAFVIVQDLFLTETAKLADVVLPAAPFTEREGCYTSGERRVQRFMPAVPARPGPRADFAIAAQLGQRLGWQLEGRAASLVMAKVAAQVPDYAGVTYQAMTQVSEQWPIVGRSDLYYGGTTYENSQGMGVQLAPAVQRGEPAGLPKWSPPAPAGVAGDGLLLAPFARLYDKGSLMAHSILLEKRQSQAALWVHPATAERIGLQEGQEFSFALNGSKVSLPIALDEALPVGVGLVPRSCGVPLFGPVFVSIGENVKREM